MKHFNKRQKLNGFAILLVSILNVLLFQNCSKGFEVLPQSEQLSLGRQTTGSGQYSLSSSVVDPITPPPAPTSEYDVFVVAGQSNTYVGGPLDDILDAPHDRIFEYTGAGPIIIAEDPLKSLDDRNNGNIGFVMSFAKAYVAANPTRKAVLVHCGYAGTGFSSSAPLTWTIGPGNLPAQCITKANAAIAETHGLMRGFLWHQGESDFGSNNTYAGNLDGLIAHFRASITGASQVPFVVGGLADEFAAEGGESGVIFQNIIADTPTRVAKAAFASAAGLPTQDGTHFSAPSQRILGGRYHEAFASIAPAN